MDYNMHACHYIQDNDFKQMKALQRIVKGTDDVTDNNLKKAGYRWTRAGSRERES